MAATLGPKYLGKQSERSRHLRVLNSPGVTCRSGNKERSILHFAKATCTSSRRSAIKSSDSSDKFGHSLSTKANTQSWLANAYSKNVRISTCNIIFRYMFAPICARCEACSVELCSLFLGALSSLEVEPLGSCSHFNSSSFIYRAGRVHGLVWSKMDKRYCHTFCARSRRK